MQLGCVTGVPSSSSLSSPHFVGLMAQDSPPVAEAAGQLGGVACAAHCGEGIARLEG